MFKNKLNSLYLCLVQVSQNTLPHAKKTKKMPSIVLWPASSIYNLNLFLVALKSKKENDDSTGVSQIDSEKPGTWSQVIFLFSNAFFET